MLPVGATLSIQLIITTALPVVPKEFLNSTSSPATFSENVLVKILSDPLRPEERRVPGALSVKVTSTS